jgi:hypothetical protein
MYRLNGWYLVGQNLRRKTVWKRLGGMCTQKDDEWFALLLGWPRADECGVLFGWLVVYCWSGGVGVTLVSPLILIQHEKSKRLVCADVRS